MVQYVAVTRVSFGPPESVRCSFCSKDANQVRKLVGGPGVFICNECVELCVEIFEDEGLEWRIRS